MGWGGGWGVDIRSGVLSSLENRVKSPRRQPKEGQLQRNLFTATKFLGDLVADILA